MDPMNLENDKQPLSGDGAGKTYSSKMVLAATAVAGCCGLAIGIAIGVDGGSQQVSEDNGDGETSTSAQDTFTSARASSSGGFCYSCDNAPSRGWSWWFGWGECECYEGWQGACCDESVVLEENQWGPYTSEAGQYKLFQWATEDTIDKMVYPVSDDNDDGFCATTYIDASGNAVAGSVPCQFSGLWWMDGNPASDYVASFGRSNWISKDEGGCVNSGDDPIIGADETKSVNCLGSLAINVFDDKMWSWHDEGLVQSVLYSGILGVQLTYTFECGGNSETDLTICQIYPSAGVPWWSGAAWFTVPPSAVSFDMTFGGDDAGGNLWIRNSMVNFPPISWLMSEPHNYWLKRISDGDGNKVQPHWDDYMSDAGNDVVTGHNSFNDAFGKGAQPNGDKVSSVHATQNLACMTRGSDGTERANGCVTSGANGGL